MIPAELSQELTLTGAGKVGWLCQGLSGSKESRIEDSDQFDGRQIQRTEFVAWRLAGVLGSSWI